MPEASTDATLKSQYAAQVAADLARNTEEQERVGSELAALQDRLAALRKDHALLMSIESTLGSEAARSERVPAPRPPAGAGTGSRRGKGRPKAKGGPAAKPVRTGNGGKARGSGSALKLPELVARHLATHEEPSSTAEVTAELTRSHPGRTLNATLVRNALETLVAKGSAERSKQQRSVFYTAVRAQPAQEPAETSEPAGE